MWKTCGKEQYQRHVWQLYLGFQSEKEFNPIYCKQKYTVGIRVKQIILNIMEFHTIGI